MHTGHPFRQVLVGIESLLHALAEVTDDLKSVLVKEELVVGLVFGDDVEALNQVAVATCLKVGVFLVVILA